MAKRRFWLIPRDESFFELFLKSAGLLVRGAELLQDLVSNFDDVAAKGRRLHDIEHEADEVTHEVMRRLNTTFVTPLDREDIHELASLLDDVMDHMDAAADLMVLHKIEKPLPEMLTQVDLLVMATATTRDALSVLPDFRSLSEYFVEVNRLENEGDRITREALGRLFADERMGAADLVKWKDLYDLLEQTMDKCEYIANLLVTITIKNA